MLGAVIGEVIGSVYEFGNTEKTKDFILFTNDCRPTDDSVLTVAVGCACVEADLYDEQSFKYTLIKKLRETGMMYPDAGYGKRFYQWMITEEDVPYGGRTNGAAMRVSPVGWAAESLEMAERLGKWSAEVTHNSAEGTRGAASVAAAVYLARTGHGKDEIRSYIGSKYYDLDFTVDQIRPDYAYDITCENSVPQAIVCFLDSTGFVDAIRNAVSLGGDGDTQACIAGAIAEAYYGVPDELAERVTEYMDDQLYELFEYYADQLY